MLVRNARLINNKLPGGRGLQDARGRLLRPHGADQHRRPDAERHRQPEHGRDRLHALVLEPLLLEHRVRRPHRRLRPLELEPVELELHRQRRHGRHALELEPVELVHELGQVARSRSSVQPRSHPLTRRRYQKPDEAPDGHAARRPLPHEPKSPKGRIRWAVTALAVACCAALPATAGASSARSQVIVQLDAGASAAAVKAQVRDYGGTRHRRPADHQRLRRRSSPTAPRRSLQRFDGVRAVTQNAGGQAAGRSTPPSCRRAYPSSVDAIEAWTAVANATGKGVGVAVIDTGIAGDLPDFRSSQSRHAPRASSPRSSPTRTRRAPTTRYGHGTHVAGHHRRQRRQPPDARPARRRLRRRRARREPDLDQGRRRAGQRDRARRDLRPAVRRRPQGRPTTSASSTCRWSPTTPQSYKTDPLDAAVESAWFNGIVVVAAAGNRGTAADAVDYAPGNDPYVISVGAVDDQGTQGRRSTTRSPTWSSRGTHAGRLRQAGHLRPGRAHRLDLAPNSAFASLCPTCIVDGQYIRAGGTSMAAPVVAGAAALLLQAHPSLTPNQVKGVLVATGAHGQRRRSTRSTRTRRSSG